jgi:biotin operon repressor
MVMDSMEQVLIKNEPLYMQLKKKLRLLIDTENLSILPRERDIEKMYGVSRITVRKAIQELTKAGIVTPVQGRGTMVSSHMPVPGRELGVFAGSHGWYIENLFSAVSAEAKILKYNVNTFVMNYSNASMALPSSNTLFSHLIASDKLNGLLLASKMPEPSMAYLVKRKMPMVVSGIKYKRFDIPSVRFTFMDAFEEMTKTLLNYGLDRIACVGESDSSEEEDNAIGDLTAFQETHAHIVKTFGIPLYNFPKRGIDTIESSMKALYALPAETRPQVVISRFHRDKDAVERFVEGLSDWKPLLISSGTMDNEHPRIVSSSADVIRKALHLLVTKVENPEQEIKDEFIPVDIIIPEKYLITHKE